MDLETDISAKSHKAHHGLAEPIEIAFMRLETNGELTMLFNKRFKPLNGRIEREASNVHGIYMRHLKKEPYFSKADVVEIQKLLHQPGVKVELWAFNMKFDEAILRNAYKNFPEF